MVQNRETWTTKVDQSNTTENRSLSYFDYRIAPKVLFIKDDIYDKANNKNDGPYFITEVFSNGPGRIQQETINKRINVRTILPTDEYTLNDFCKVVGVRKVSDGSMSRSTCSER